MTTAETAKAATAATGSFSGALVFVGLNALVTVFAYLVIVKDIRRIELQPQ